MNVRPQTIKLLEENIGGELLKISFSNVFCASDSKDNRNKSKNKQMGLHQTKNFCTAKETIIKMKRQPTEWEKIFANHVSNKGLISKIYKELIQLNNNKKQAN